MEDLLGVDIDVAAKRENQDGVHDENEEHGQDGRHHQSRGGGGQGHIPGQELGRNRSPTWRK